MDYNQDQLFHDLEQRYVSLKNERDALSSENVALKGSESSQKMLLLGHSLGICNINCLVFCTGKIESLVNGQKALQEHSDGLQRELAHKDSVAVQVSVDLCDLPCAVYVRNYHFQFFDCALTKKLHPTM